ncbi:flavin reductase family protein [Streptomyces sp. NPDC056061]|uniref:flavin reductase family protein n=1 Tax=Streptomyces sp. NPDC056061 TaxID=3345700 RepID=UPI0035D9A4AB
MSAPPVRRAAAQRPPVPAPPFPAARLAAPGEGAGEERRLRRAFGSFPTGVTVVTVGGAVPRGMTANSFTSVSLDPPLVLVCVAKEARMRGSLAAAPDFAVSVLGADQEHVARHFADRSRPPGADQFDAVDWFPGPATGAPVLTGAVAHFECRAWRSYDGGDHTLHVGRVLSWQEAPDRDTLLFHRGRLGSIGRPGRSPGAVA